MAPQSKAHKVICIMRVGGSFKLEMGDVCLNSFLLLPLKVSGYTVLKPTKASDRLFYPLVCASACL
jgi:hypothetical protein